MQTTHFWSKLYLHSAKVAAIVMLVLLASTANAQQKKVSWVKRNNPNYDQKKLSYGFLIGLHTSAYQIKYSDKFVSQEFDTLYSVEPGWSAGFALGFIMNYKLADLLDLRLTPTVAFYEHTLFYRYTDDQPNHEELVETTMVELPLLLKFKSERRDNLRMYMIGGIKPAIEASGKKELRNVTSALEVTGGNLSIDVGFGLDIYYPLFKFSPELRFSRGMVNVLDNTTNIYGQPLQRVNTNTVSLYLVFQ